MYVASQSTVCEWHQFQGLNEVIYSPYRQNFRACGGQRGNLITPSRTRPPVGARLLVPTHWTRAVPTLRPAAAGSRRVGERIGSQPSLHLPSTCAAARGPFAARLDARALRRSCARTPKSGQLVPAQRPTDACCARGRQISSQHSLHLPSTGALLRLAP